MFHNIRFQLLIMMIVVVAISVGTVALVASRVTQHQFQHYLDSDTTHQQQVSGVTANVMKMYYFQHQNWGDDVQAIIGQLGQTTTSRIELLDQRGVVIADSLNQDVGKSVPMSRIATNGYITDGEQIRGAVMVYSSPSSPVDNSMNEAEFISSVNTYFLLAAIFAVTVALLLTLTLARRISRPIEALTVAVRKMEKGDLTQRVLVKQRNEIAELARAFNAMADNLAHNEQLRRNMVSDVAHELRTPLSCILGYLEALQDGIAAPDYELIDSLYEEATLLKRLVSDLQDLSLADAGRLKLVCGPINIAELIDQAISAFKQQAHDKALTLAVDISSGLPPVYADAERVGQILRNLLKNAINYTLPYGKITVSTSVENAEIAVTVRDTGIGIEAEHIPYVFERFYRTDQSRTQATGGAGLGLAIVKQLVEAQHGHVWAESVPNGGSTFAFTLPLN